MENDNWMKCRDNSLTFRIQHETLQLADQSNKNSDIRFECVKHFTNISSMFLLSSFLFHMVKNKGFVNMLGQSEVR